MAICDVCGKGLQYGHKVSHSKRATNRSWRPNLQKVRAEMDGKPVTVYVCSRCLRTMRKSA